MRHQSHPVLDVVCVFCPETNYSLGAWKSVKVAAIDEIKIIRPVILIIAIIKPLHHYDIFSF